jgi:hypothetical protein
MTVHTLQARTRFDVVGGVQSLSRNEARSNFVVTAKALENGFASRDLVAGNTVGHAVDRLVGSRERTRRYLCYGQVRIRQETQHDIPQNERPRETAKGLNDASDRNRCWRFDTTTHSGHSPPLEPLIEELWITGSGRLSGSP